MLIFFKNADLNAFLHVYFIIYHEHCDMLDVCHQKHKKSIDIASLSTLAQLNINPQELEALQEQFPQILKLADSFVRFRC